MKSCKITILTEDETETRMVGFSLGRWARPGDVVALLGELGSGKTCLTQGLAHGLDVPESCCVRSPSFVILNTYPGRCPLHHLDLYRIRDASELEDLGWREILYGEAVCAIEWADKMEDLLPDEHIRAWFVHRSEMTRWIEIEVIGERYEDRWEVLRRSLARFERVGLDTVPSKGSMAGHIPADGTE